MARIRRAARQASALAISPPLENPTALTSVTGSQRPMASTSAEQRRHVVRVPEAVVVRRVGIGDEVAGRVVGEARVALQPVAALARAVEREDQRARAARPVGDAQQRVQRQVIGARRLRRPRRARGAPSRCEAPPQPAASRAAARRFRARRARARLCAGRRRRSSALALALRVARQLTEGSEQAVGGARAAPWRVARSSPGRLSGLCRIGRQTRRSSLRVARGLGAAAPRALPRFHEAPRAPATACSLPLGCSRRRAAPQAPRGRGQTPRFSGGSATGPDGG